MHKTVLL